MFHIWVMTNHDLASSPISCGKHTVPLKTPPLTRAYQELELISAFCFLLSSGIRNRVKIIKAKWKQKLNGCWLRAYQQSDSALGVPIYRAIVITPSAVKSDPCSCGMPAYTSNRCQAGGRAIIINVLLPTITFHFISIPTQLNPMELGAHHISSDLI